MSEAGSCWKRLACGECATSRYDISHTVTNGRSRSSWRWLLEPRVLLLDEPAAGLSVAETRPMIELINSLDPALTLLIIEHDMDVAFEVATEITVLHNGQVLAHGSRDEIRANSSVRDVYLGRALSSRDEDTQHARLGGSSHSYLLWREPCPPRCRSVGDLTGKWWRCWGGMESEDHDRPLDRRVHPASSRQFVFKEKEIAGLSAQRIARMGISLVPQGRRVFGSLTVREHLKIFGANGGASGWDHALDAQVRKELRTWLRRLHDEMHVTTVFVTHDQEEAMDVADRIVVIANGASSRSVRPTSSTKQPANDFVMSFLGPVTRLGGRLVRPHDLELCRGRDAGDTHGARSYVSVRLGFEVRVEMLM